jgi:hypothetical protein
MPIKLIFSGKDRSQKALQVLARDPLTAIGLFAGAMLAIMVIPIWGVVHPWSGWQKARERLPEEGLFALGEILVPSNALNDYQDGIIRGFLRVHASGLSFLIMQAPILYILLKPSEYAADLFEPVGQSFAFNSDVSMAFSEGVPMLFCLAAGVIMAGHSLIAVRLLGEMPAPHPISSTFAAVKEAWRQTLKDIRPLVSIGLLTALIGAGGKVFATLNLRGAEKLSLGGAEGPGDWVLFALTVLVGVALLEALGRWAKENTTPLAASESSYSVVQKLTQEEIPALLEWLHNSAVRIAEGTALVFVLYFLADTTMKLSWLVKRKENVDISLGGFPYVAWFIVSAGLIIFLKMRSKNNSSNSTKDKGAA